MTKEIQEAMNEEILNRIEELESISVNKEDYAKAVSSIVKLGGLQLDIYKVDCEYSLKKLEFEEQKEKNRKDQELKEMDSRSSKKESIVNYGFKTMELVLPMVGSWVWMSRCLQFEEKGSFTSLISRNQVNRTTKI